MSGVKQNKWFRLGCILIAALVVLLSYRITPPEGLTADGLKMLSIVVAAMILFISEAIPMTATCFAIIATMKYTGVATMPELMKTSASTAVFFCMAGFGLAGALQNTNLVNVMLRYMYNLSGRDPRKMISVICILTAFLSIFTANGVAQIVVLSIVTSIIKAFGDPEPGTSRLAGGLMMAIFVGATTGGMFLPCSNGPNMVVIEMVQPDMPFYQWALFGIPCGIILTLFAAWRLPKYFKPEELTQQQRDDIEKVFEQIPNTLDSKDKKYIAIMCLMMVLWFASTWVKVLDVATVAMVGVALMMLPGIDLLSGKDFKKNFSPMNVVILLCIFPMAAGMNTTGAGEWIADKIFADTSGWNMFTLIILATLTAFLINTIVPSGSANATLSATVICPVLIAAGMPVAAAVVLVGIQAGTEFLFPIEGTWQYTFGTEHYSFSDCFKGNWPIAIVGMLCCMVVVPLLALLYNFLGII